MDLMIQKIVRDAVHHKSLTTFNRELDNAQLAMYGKTESEINDDDYEIIRATMYIALDAPADIYDAIVAFYGSCDVDVHPPLSAVLTRGSFDHLRIFAQYYTKTIRNDRKSCCLGLKLLMETQCQKVSTLMDVAKFTINELSELFILATVHGWTQLFIDLGVSVDHGDAIIHAISRKHFTAVKALCDAGANLDKVTSDILSTGTDAIRLLIEDTKIQQMPTLHQEHEPAIAEIRKSMVAEIRESVTAEIRESVTTENRDSVIAEIRDSVIAEIRDSVIADIRKSAIAEIRESVTADVRNAAIAEIREAVIADVRESVTTEIREAVTTENRNSVTAHIRESVTTEIRESVIAEIRESVTADICEDVTIMLKRIDEESLSAALHHATVAKNMQTIRAIFEINSQYNIGYDFDVLISETTWEMADLPTFRLFMEEIINAGYEYDYHIGFQYAVAIGIVSDVKRFVEQIHLESDYLPDKVKSGILTLCVKRNSKHCCKIIKFLLDTCQFTDEQKESCFLMACNEGAYDIVDLMFRYNIDINCRDKISGFTGIMVAAQNGYIDIVELLLAGNIDTTLINNAGKTVHQFSKYSPKCLELINKHDNLKTSVSTTPFEDRKNHCQCCKEIYANMSKYVAKKS